MATIKADSYNQERLRGGQLGVSYISEMVECFQKINGIKVDGEAGPDTCALLADLVKKRAPEPAPFPSCPLTKDWTGLLNKYRGSVPLKYLQLWIDEESGGNNLSLGLPRVEAGIFQTYHPDDDHWGATYAQLRVNGKDGTFTPLRALTWDEADLQVKAGVAYVTNCLAVTSRQLAMTKLVWPADDVYPFAKLRHGLPVFGTQFLPYYVTKVVAGSRTFASFAAWIRGLSLHDFADISPAAASFYEGRDRILKNAEYCSLTNTGPGV